MATITNTANVNAPVIADASAPSPNALPAGAPIKEQTSFDTMDLKTELLRGIYAYGFEKPSIIQSLGIVPLSKGGDVLAQAQSGTGMTVISCPRALLLRCYRKNCNLFDWYVATT